MRRTFIVLTWLAALALPATMLSICIVNCCALRAAMPHCSEMAKLVAQKPLSDAAPAKKPLNKIARTDAPRIAAPLAPPRPAPFVRAPPGIDRDVGLHILHAALLI